MDQPPHVSTPSAAERMPHTFRSDIPGRFNEVDVLQRHWARLLAVLQGDVVPPYEVLIHPSSTCNLRCDWCIGDHVPIVDRDTQKVIDASKACATRLPDNLAEPSRMMRVIDGILDYRERARVVINDNPVEHDFRVEAVSFSGLIGEPLVSKRSVLLAMEKLKAAGLRVGIFTNGTLMDDDVRELLVNIDYAHVSIDAATGETYARLKCGGGKQGIHLFNRAMDNLDALVRRRRQLHTSHLDVNASFILYPENYREVYDAAVQLRELGVHCLRIKQDNSGMRSLNAAQRGEALMLLDRIEERLTTQDFRLVRIHHIEDAAEARWFSTCTITELMAAIGSDGDLYPCNYHPRPGGASYGSAIAESFASVWKGARRRELRSRLPTICPPTCDPFKNRANSMLASFRSLSDRGELHEMQQHRDELVGKLVG